MYQHAGRVYQHSQDHRHSLKLLIRDILQFSTRPTSRLWQSWRGRPWGLSLGPVSHGVWDRGKARRGQQGRFDEESRDPPPPRGSHWQAMNGMSASEGISQDNLVSNYYPDLSRDMQLWLSYPTWTYPGPEICKSRHLIPTYPGLSQSTKPLPGRPGLSWLAQGVAFPDERHGHHSGRTQAPPSQIWNSITFLYAHSGLKFFKLSRCTVT